ncbi:hypothetical protein niasHT_018263 [Heterodera trifolii]|uniref:Uncharacterized protein n=1 Tax=Heterodera trifolii TaxID=157864 RepID=A0ABD2L5K5_9BILA
MLSQEETGIDCSEPLYVELKDLMVCPGDLQKCLSHFGHRKDHATWSSTSWIGTTKTTTSQKELGERAMLV